MADVREIAEQHCQKNGLNISLCFDMPAGYETANGMYDPESKTVFINGERLAKLPDYEKRFYLYHELRHASQYLMPIQLDEQIIRSLQYVIGYDGECWKRTEDGWKSCLIEGTEVFFTQMYLAQPYEMDANTFAYREVKAAVGESEELQKLYSFWMPESDVPFERFEALYAMIDQRTDC